LSFLRVGEALKCLSRAYRHRVVLRDDGIHCNLAGDSQLQPSLDAALAALFGPFPTQQSNAEILRTNHFKARLAVLGRHAFAGAGDVEGRAAFVQKSAQLAGLNPADFLVLAGDQKGRRPGTSAQLRNIIGVAIQQTPTNAGLAGGLGYLR
jgi:hypothetical protein